MEIGISEMQKNISLFRNLREPLRIVDKKTKETLAMVLPRRHRGTRIVQQLDGVFRNYRPEGEYTDTKSMIEAAYAAEMEAKYGR